MKDYTRLYSDILFYTKELEAIEKELNLPTLSNDRKGKLEREKAKLKEKLDGLVEKIPEISENPTEKG